MAETSAIEWTDSTFNPWIGCTKISPACDHCYAEALMDTRHGRVKWGGERSRTSAGNWQQPRRWQKHAAAFRAEHGRRQRVFCSSLADVFDNQVPVEWRDDLWSLIRDTPDLDWQLLTKRPQNISKMLPAYWDDVKGHVWLGTTVEDQKRADMNIPHLMRHDSAVRFVSVEPMLGPIDLEAIRPAESVQVFGFPIVDALRGCHMRVPYGVRPRSEPGECRVNWVIAGGESGPKARPTHPDWFRSLRDQCAAAGVPFLFKQWGEWAPVPSWYENHHTSLPMQVWDGEGWNDSGAVDGDWLARVGKKRAGRALDDIEHNGFPVSA